MISLTVSVGSCVLSPPMTFLSRVCVEEPTRGSNKSNFRMLMSSCVFVLAQTIALSFYGEGSTRGFDTRNRTVSRCLFKLANRMAATLLV
jgi:hypothetical protein